MGFAPFSPPHSYRRGDAYVHADLHGASSTIVRNHTPDKPLPPLTLQQAGCACVCRSRAWEQKVVTSAWWVHHEQVGGEGGRRWEASQWGPNLWWLWPRVACMFIACQGGYCGCVDSGSRWHDVHLQMREGMTVTSLLLWCSPAAMLAAVLPTISHSSPRRCPRQPPVASTCPPAAS